MTDPKDAALLKILMSVPFDGWTMKAVEAAGLSSIDFRSLFPRGLVDLIEHFADWADRAMDAALSDTDLEPLRVREKIAALVKARLLVLEPHQEAVRKEIAYLAVSGHPGLGPKLIWRSASRMWYRAGDTATDYNYYTKRTLLSGVIAAMTLYWLADSSPEKDQSWAFLDRRIDEVLRFGKAIGQVKKFADPSGFIHAFSAFTNFVRGKSPSG